MHHATPAGGRRADAYLHRMHNLASMGALSFDVSYFLALALRVGIAYALTLIIGFERERNSHSAGLRTFPLVALSSCAFILVGVAVFGPASDSVSRMLQGLITAVGFIGGGAIVKDQQRVRGTATAAAIWAASGIGAAVALGQVELAVLVTVITYGTLRLLRRFEPNVGD
jgi:putative Mg2+ transporter-C (MgtC) family protein